MEKPKIIISGGDGFIGSAIIKQFHNQFRFIVLKRQGSLIHFPEIENLCNLQFEPDNIKTTNSLFSNAIGMILLGASRPDPGTQSLFKDVSEIEVNHTKRMMDLCVANKINRVIFASSKSVYGINDSKPFDENKDSFPDSIYGLNKLLTEKLGLYYEQKHGIKFTALRLAQVFGIGDNYPNVIHVFMKNAILNKDLEIWGDGNSDCRTYIYVKDVADAFIHFIETGITGDFNIGMNKTFSPKQIAEYIVKHKLTNSQVVYKSEKNVIYRKEQFSIIKTKNKANWQNSWEMEQALNDFLNELKALNKK